MVDIKKEIDSLRILETALLAMHAALLDTLESIRRNSDKCVSCGKDLQEHEEEYCEKCYNEWLEMVRPGHPDQRRER